MKADQIRQVMRELGRRGGAARAQVLTPKRRREIARLGGQATARKRGRG
jgi:general stress protein YciG